MKLSSGFPTSVRNVFHGDAKPNQLAGLVFCQSKHVEHKVGAGKKDDPADVAKAGFMAMKEWNFDVVTGLKNKLSTMAASVTPSGMVARRARKMAQPASAKR